MKFSMEKIKGLIGSFARRLAKRTKGLGVEFQLSKKKTKRPVRWLTLNGYQPGLVVEDSYGKKYVVVANRAGKPGGIRKIEGKNLELLQESGIQSFPSRTLEEINAWIQEQK